MRHPLLPTLGGTQHSFTHHIPSWSTSSSLPISRSRAMTKTRTLPSMAMHGRWASTLAVPVEASPCMFPCCHVQAGLSLKEPGGGGRMPGQRQCHARSFPLEIRLSLCLHLSQYRFCGTCFACILLVAFLAKRPALYTSESRVHHSPPAPAPTVPDGTGLEEQLAKLPWTRQHWLPGHQSRLLFTLCREPGRTEISPLMFPGQDVWVLGPNCVCITGITGNCSRVGGVAW
ncbi:hypothetical protein GGR56DRAFT_67944 [Xylariaceae sp. FL0804]|nr:hypothetical protein GGR56DRAFT_67944 [Xylariaceae sp. FL0804]